MRGVWKEGQSSDKWAVLIALQGAVSEDMDSPVGNKCVRKRRGRGRGGTDVLDGRAEQFGLGVAGVGLQI